MYSELVVTPRGCGVLVLPPCGLTRQQLTAGRFAAQDLLVSRAIADIELSLRWCIPIYNRDFDSQESEIHQSVNFRVFASCEYNIHCVNTDVRCIFVSVCTRVVFLV
jgi:hypothetical protein